MANTVTLESEIETDTLCRFCGQPEILQIFEWWFEDRSFMLETCCEDLHAWTVEVEMPSMTRKDWQAWFKSQTGEYVRQIIADGGPLTLDYGLDIVPVQWRIAKRFVADHHRHCNRPPAGWRFGTGLNNGRELVAVTMAGRPSSKAYDPAKVIEITRVCVQDMRPHGLTWNACSMLYGWVCRESQHRGFEKVITYTLAKSADAPEHEEEGVSLRAAGFVPVGTTKGGSWNRPSRPRTDAAPTTPKIRWERVLRPKRQQRPHDRAAA